MVNIFIVFIGFHEFHLALKIAHTGIFPNTIRERFFLNEHQMHFNF